MLSDIVYNGLALNQSSVIHKVIGNTCIVDFGVITKIVDDGLVEVKFGENRVTVCVLVNISGGCFTINIEAQVGDKVLVLFPRQYNSKMFTENTWKSEDGYCILGGLAILCNKGEVENNLSVDKNGNVEINTKGKYKISNNATSLKDVVKDIIDVFLGALSTDLNASILASAWTPASLNETIPQITAKLNNLFS